MDDATKVAALSLLLRGTAAIWNETLDATTQKNSFENFKKAFTTLFFSSEEFKSLQIGKIWLISQIKGASCDDYIEKILRQAIPLAMPNEQSLHAIINGLQPSIKMYVYAKTLQRWKSCERPPNWLKIQKCD